MKRFYSQTKFLAKDFVVGIKEDGTMTKKAEELIQDKSFIKNLKWEKEKVRIHYQNDQRFAILKMDNENDDLKEQYSESQRVNFVDPISKAVSKLKSDSDSTKIFIDDFQSKFYYHNIQTPKMYPLVLILELGNFQKLVKKRKLLNLNMNNQKKIGKKEKYMQKHKISLEN